MPVKVEFSVSDQRPGPCQPCQTLAQVHVRNSDLEALLQNSSHHQSAIKLLGIIRRVLDTRAGADTRKNLFVGSPQEGWQTKTRTVSSSPLALPWMITESQISSVPNLEMRWPIFTGRLSAPAEMSPSAELNSAPETSGCLSVLECSSHLILTVAEFHVHDCRVGIPGGLERDGQPLQLSVTARWPVADNNA